MKKMLLAVALVGLSALGVELRPMHTNLLVTAWGREVTPANAWREYPRPQLVRDNWQCLNGEWEFVVTSTVAEAPKKYPQRILVPFPVESKLSGICRPIKPGDQMWYRRKFTATPRKGERLLLNFERADFRTQVYVNGVEAMDVPHEGGNVPFSVDVTDFVKSGENELVVSVWDPTDEGPGGNGKQTLKRTTAFFGTVSGLCGSVWAECVPETYLADWRIDADAAKGTVAIKPELRGKLCDVQVEAVVSFGGKELARGALAKDRDAIEIALPHPLQLWSCEHPNLYDVVLTVRSASGVDRVKGYFGVRTIATALDARGIRRITLNGEFTYLLGTLDQGWWPDGLLTPPSEAACRFDVDFHKKAGFNMIRKHVKIEPRAFYAHCDRVGIMVMQDIPSGGATARLHDKAASNFRYGFYRRELKDCVEMLRNHPCIVVWIPFNEGWGQPGPDKTLDVIRWLKRTDPSRLVDGASGWVDYEAKLPANEIRSDIVDLHRYPHAIMAKPNAQRVCICGEFGGLHISLAGHSYDPMEPNGDFHHNYLKMLRDSKGQALFEEPVEGGTWRERGKQRYLELMKPVIDLARQGMGGSVFTEPQDQYWEFMGFLTFDRAVLKFDYEFLREIHNQVYEAARTGANGVK